MEDKSPASRESLSVDNLLANGRRDYRIWAWVCLGLTIGAAVVGLVLIVVGAIRGDGSTVGPWVWIAPFFALPLTIFVVILRVVERIDVLRAAISKAKNAKEAIEIVQTLYPRWLRTTGRKPDGAA